MGDTRTGLFSLAVWVVTAGHIVALATPNWIHVTYSDSAGTFFKIHFGFFQVCVSDGGQTSICVSFFGHGVGRYNL